MKLAKDGLRVHNVIPSFIGDVTAVGETRTALCGVTWETSVVDPDELAVLPSCYGCVFERYMMHMAEALALNAMLNDSDDEDRS